MNRRAAVALALYVVAVGSLVTPLYDTGDDDWWPVLVVVVAAHLGLGIGVARAWALLPPVAVALAAFILDGAEGLAWLTLILGLPVLLALTALGWLIGRAPGRAGGAAALACVAAASFAALWSATQVAQRGPHVPASVQAELPINVSLGNLCPGAESSKSFERDVRHRAEVLVGELRKRPDHLVTYTYHYSDGGGDERRDITIHQLAEEHLSDLEAGGEGGSDCEPRLQRRIRAAM